jgi:hypothetical protein
LKLKPPFDTPSLELRNRCSTPELRWHKGIIANTIVNDQRFLHNSQSCSNRAIQQRFPLKQAVDSYLLSFKVEGKSLATIEVYRSKLYLFLWYCQHFNLPDDVNAIITNHIREFWAYLRDNPIRFGGNTTQ